MEAGWIIALWAASVPIVMMLLLFIPPYAGAVASLWWIYGDKMANKWYDISLVINSMQSMFRYWQKNPQLDLVDYVLPAFAPFTIGCIVSIVSCIMFYRYIRGVFRA
jgi:hypothetical protein